MTMTALLAILGSLAALLATLVFLVAVRSGVIIRNRAAPEERAPKADSRWLWLLTVISLAAMSFTAFAGLYKMEMDAEPQPASGQTTKPRVTPPGALGPVGSVDDPFERLRNYVQNPSQSFPQSPIPAHPRQRRAGLPSVDTMIARLAERLKKSPNDAEGWRMLGWSYFNTGRYEEAAKAYERAIGLRGDAAPWHAAYGEALVKAAGGMVTPQAKAAFDRAIAHNKADHRARYYLGLAQKQRGDKNGALETWIALLKDVPHEKGWARDLRADILALAGEMNLDVGARLPPTQPAKMADMPDMAAPMAPEQRRQAIERMVEGLASRLEQAPKDPDGWIKLIRSRHVLKEHDKARDALRRALAVFEKEPDVQRRIAGAAKALGVTIN